MLQSFHDVAAPWRIFIGTVAPMMMMGSVVASPISLAGQAYQVRIDNRLIIVDEKVVETGSHHDLLP